jgi:hypothetical protein
LVAFRRRHECLFRLQWSGSSQCVSGGVSFNANVNIVSLSGLFISAATHAHSDVDALRVRQNPKQLDPYDVVRVSVATSTTAQPSALTSFRVEPASVDDVDDIEFLTSVKASLDRGVQSFIQEKPMRIADWISLMDALSWLLYFVAPSGPKGDPFFDNDITPIR